MAREARRKYPDACHHLINRGNYRRWVCEKAGAKDTCEQCLAVGAVRSGPVVHAWVVMGSPFHQALETAEVNVCAEIQRLQTTQAARLGRLPRERLTFLKAGTRRSPSDWEAGRERAGDGSNGETTGGSKIDQ